MTPQHIFASVYGIFPPPQEWTVRASGVHAADVVFFTPTDDKIGFYVNVATATLTVGMLYHEWLDFPDVFHVFDDIPVMEEETPPTNSNSTLSHTYDDDTSFR